MRFTKDYIIAVLIIAVGVLSYLYFGREVNMEQSQRVIDSLTQDKAEALRQRDIAQDSSDHYKIQAATWFIEAQKTPKQKIVTQIQYVQDTAFNRSLSQLKRDSIIRARFLTH